MLPGERIHAEITADAWRYLGLNVPYDRRTILFGGPLGILCTGLASMIGNRRARRAAAAMAAPQWRYLGHLPLIVSNRRMLVACEGEWWPVWFEMIERCDLSRDTAVLTFRDDAPYCLRSGDLSSVIPFVSTAAVP